jgi:magnesium chelatase family protein
MTTAFPIHIEVPRVDYEKLSDDRFGESSAKVQACVEAARDLQRQRFRTNPDGQSPQGSIRISSNSDMHPAEIRKHCALDVSSQSLMRSAMSQMQLSAHAYHRVLKLARTIADLADDVKISPQHLAKALWYRPRSIFM